MLRQIVGKKRDEIHNLELHKVTNTDPIDRYVIRQRLRWAGHVRRMPDCRIPKKVMFGNLVGGKKCKGRPLKTWIDCFEEDLERIKLNRWNWFKKAEHRLAWADSLSSLTSNKRKK